MVIKLLGSIWDLGNFGLGLSGLKGFGLGLVKGLDNFGFKENGPKGRKIVG